MKQTDFNGFKNVLKWHIPGCPLSSESSLPSAGEALSKPHWHIPLLELELYLTSIARDLRAFQDGIFKCVIILDIFSLSNCCSCLTLSHIQIEKNQEKSHSERNCRYQKICPSGEVSVCLTGGRPDTQKMEHRHPPIP